MSSEVGTGHVAIVPSMRGFKRATRREITAAGQDGGNRFEKALSRAGRDSGVTAGKGFKAMFGRGLQETVSQATSDLKKGVARAASEVSKARLSEQDAAGKVRIAEAQLAEARKKNAADSSQVIRAEERLATVSRALEAAQLRTAASTNVLKDAQDQLAASAVRVARGMGFKRAARDLLGVLAPVRLVGRALTGPLRKGIASFADGWSNVSKLSSNALVKLGQNTRVAMSRVALSAVNVGAKVAAPFAKAWSAVADGARTVAGRVQRVFAPVGRWFAPMTGALRTSLTSARNLVGGLGPIFRGIGPIVSRAASAMGSAWRSGMRVLSDTASATAQGIKNTFTSVGVAVGAALVGSLAGGWSRMTGIENAQAKLEGLGHSTEAVASIMDSALQSVQGTAFGLGDAASIAASAVAAGVKPGKELTRYLSTTAAAAAAAGVPLAEMGSILNKVQTNTRASTEEMNQLADRGLPIWQALSKQMGVSQEDLRDMVSEGKVGSADFVAAVESMSGDVAAAMGKTTSGMLANMRTAFSRFGARVLTPFQDSFKGLFQTITAGVDALTKTFGPVVDLIADKVNGVLLPAFERMQDVFARGFTIDLSAFDGIAGVLAILAPLIGAFIGPLLQRLPLIGGAFSALTGPVGIFAGLLVSLLAVDPATIAAGFETLVPAVVSIFGDLILKVVEVVPELIRGIMVRLGENLPFLLQGITSLVLGMVGVIVGLLPSVAEAFLGLIPLLVSTILGMVPDLIDAGLALFTGLVQALVLIVPMLITAIVGLLPKIATALIMMIPQIVTAALALFQGILQALVLIVPMLITQLMTLIPVLITTILEMLPALIEGALTLFLGLVLALVEVIPQLLTAVVEMLPQLIETLIGMIPTLITTAIELFLALVLGLVQAIPQIISALIGLLPVIIETMLGMLPLLIETAIDLFIGIATGIIDALPTIIDTITNELGPALVGAVLGIGPALLEAGGSIFGAIGEGITGALGGIGDAVSGGLEWIGGFFPQSPAKRGPFSGSGWAALSKSGAAVSEEFAAGIESAQRAITMPAIVPGATGTPAAGAAGAAGAQFTQINHIAHLDPEVAIESTGQRMAAAARRVGV